MSVDKRLFPTEIEYPESDGEPMAETDIHRDLMVDLIEGLKLHFQDDPMVYVSGNMLLYYEEGNNRKSVAPDVFVVRGIPKHRRRVYKLWQEAHPPDVVFEVSSRGTCSTLEREGSYRPIVKSKLQDDKPNPARKMRSLVRKGRSLARKRRSLARKRRSLAR